MTEASRKEHGRRRIELSLVLEFGEEQYLGADGEVNEDIMRREALDYAAEAARNGEFDIEISLIDEKPGDA
ncbi:hypothetical protein [Halococcus salifodinae]|uniref:Uncharacterized protein n=1 Tax=Halococcus salifodinae DSM 8989 TaxID=1227456 RepID=M0N8S5_9EURY|nr:hypothetical protein [Halococcus salifodinae]EMA54372.1 hypothetical protein C450_06065 [Halococcus salifodinae DSM 8989]